MSKIIPYIVCDSALELLNHYTDIFGDVLVSRAKLTEEMAKNMNYEKNIEESTMHMVMSIGDHLLMASDDMAGYGVYPQRILLDFNMDDPSEVDRIQEISKKFENNSECTTLMPLEKQFWGGMMGQYKDKFGNLFMLHAHSFAEQIKQGGKLEKYYTEK